MKKLTIVLIVLIFSCLAVFAQETPRADNESYFYFKTAKIFKIYTYNAGYRIVYEKANLELREFMIPMKWFQAGGKGELIWGNDASYPYFSVFWKDGQFDHIKLYLVPDLNHKTWASNENDSETENKISAIENINITEF